MNGNIETLNHHGADFPAHWGTPPGSQFSEERAAWVRARVGEELVGKYLTRGGDAKAALAVVRAMREETLS